MKILNIIAGLIGVWGAFLVIRGYPIGIVGIVLAIAFVLILRQVKSFPEKMLGRAKKQVGLIDPANSIDEAESESDEEDNGVPFIDTRQTTRRTGPQFQRLGMNDKEADEASQDGTSYKGYTDINEVLRSGLEERTAAANLEYTKLVKEMLDSGEIDLHTANAMLRRGAQKKRRPRTNRTRTVYVEADSKVNKDDFGLRKRRS